MRCLLAIHQLSGETLQVHVQLPSDKAFGDSMAPLTFMDENDFIWAVVLGLSSQEETISILAHLLLTASGRVPYGTWKEIDAPLHELRALGFQAV